MEIKPCIRCGSVGRVVEYEDIDLYDQDVMMQAVECSNTSCGNSAVAFPRENEEKAIMAWNAQHDPMPKLSEPLSTDALAELFEKWHGGKARIKPMGAVMNWVEQQTDRIYVHPLNSTYHLILK